MVDLGLDQFAFDVELAFGLAISTAEGLPVLKAGVHLVVCFDHADEAKVLLVDPQLVGTLLADDIDGMTFPVVFAGLGEVEVQRVAENLTGLLEPIEVNPAEQKDEAFVVIDRDGSELPVAVAVGGIAAEDDGVATVGGAEVHTKAIGETNELVPGLSSAEAVVAVHFGGLGKSKGMVPLSCVAVVHFFDDVATRGREGKRRWGPGVMEGRRQEEDEEYSTHFG